MPGLLTDRAVLRDTYPLMKKFVDTNATTAQGYIWTGPAFGDWCPPDHSANANGGMGNNNAGDCFSEGAIVNTALSYQQALDVAHAATALGNDDDASYYTELADKIKTAFNRQFLNDDGASYGSGRQVTSVLPLAFDMVPDANLTPVGARLVETIAPQIPETPQQVAASIDTVRGTITTAWSTTNGQSTLDVTIPVGTTATVHVPSLGQSRATVSPTAGATLVGETGNDTTYTVGSGTWRFVGTLSPTSVSTLPGTWGTCAAETQDCSFTGTRTVAYGAHGQFRYATITNGTPCETTAFGADPAPGTRKACYTQPTPVADDGWQHCANESGTCAFTGTATVAYGAAGAFTYRTVANGTDCTNTVFGDPVAGTRKMCYLLQ